MRASLIRHVDPWQDAARGACYEGDLPADRLPRLGALGHLPAPLRVAISFAHDAGKQGAVSIELTIDGRMEMVCQRCLEPLAVASAVRTCVWLARDEMAARALEASAEAIVLPPGERLDLATLVEDEMLLAMPFAPCHPAGRCDVHPHARLATEQDDGAVIGPASRVSKGVGDSASSPTGDDAKRSPFAVLAALRDGTENKD